MSLTFLASEKDRLQVEEEALETIATVYTTQYPDTSFSVELRLVSKEEMQEINQTYRAMDEPTDVLSFPTFPDTQTLLNAGHKYTALIGTIIICSEKVTAYKETLPQMVHHGLLHLFGYDHETDQTSWNKAEKRILEELATKGLNIPPVTYE